VVSALVVTGLLLAYWDVSAGIIAAVLSAITIVFREVDHSLASNPTSTDEEEEKPPDEPNPKNGGAGPATLLPSVLACIVLGCAMSSCGSSDAVSRGAVEVERQEGVTYATASMSAPVGPFLVSPAATVAWCEDWATLDAEFALAIKGLYSVQSTLDCRFDQSEEYSCEVCVRYGEASYCRGFPQSVETVEEKP
jgi:hypothetical protein